MAQALCDQLFADVDDGELIQHPSDSEDFFGILEAWEDCVTPRGGGVEAALSSADAATPIRSAAAAANGGNKRPHQRGCDDVGGGDGDDGSTVLQEPAKRQRCSAPMAVAAAAPPGEGGAAKTTTTSHVTVERNRRKQMNEHLAMLRSLMPCFYVKRGDQASIIGGVVDYIKELQQLLQSLEAKKQRKAYTNHQVLSPRPPLPLKSTPPMSPRPAVVVPISPRTPPTPSSPYKVCRHPSMPLPLPPPPPAPGSAYASPAMTPTSQESSSYLLPSLDAIAAELCAYTTAINNKQQATAGGVVVLPEVKVEFSGANLVVKTVSQRAPGQAVKVIAALEGRRSLEILHAKISTVDDTAVNSFTIKIGIECDLSAEELVQEIQQAFS